jgi:isocitrate dehydrogenase kinase/phosphatase
MSKNNKIEKKNGFDLDVLTEGIRKAVSDSIQGVSDRVGAVEERMENYENTKYISTAELKRIKAIVRRRVNALLEEAGAPKKICAPQFYSAIYSEAKTYSRMGAPVGDTLERDAEEVKEFLRTWKPVDGVDALVKRAILNWRLDKGWSEDRAMDYIRTLS